MNEKQFAISMENAVDDLRMNYEHALSLSQSDARRNTEPGAVVPKVTRLQGNAREWYKERAREIREGLMADLASLRNDQGRRVTEAPTPEAAAAMQVLSMRSNVSQDELDMYQEQYGSNYNVSKALDSIAEKNDLQKGYSSYAMIDYERITRDINNACLLDIVESGGGNPLTNISINLADVKDELGLGDGTLF